MRIWHQSVNDLTLLPGYAARLREHTARCVSPGTTVDVHGVTPGTYPDGVQPIEVLRYPAAEYLLGVQLLDNVRRAEREGYDAVTVGCFFDPALTQLRSAVDIPVAALCESTLLMTTAAGTRLGLVGIAGSNTDRLLTLVDAYGFRSRIATVTGIDPPLAEDELDRAYDDPAVLLPRVESAARRCADEGADLVVPAEGVLNALLSAHDVRMLAGLPVVDAFALLLTHAEALVRARDVGGLSVSHARGYARAPEPVMDAVFPGGSSAPPSLWRPPRI